MAESTLSLDYAALRRQLARFARWDRNPNNWTSDQTTDADDILKEGLRRFYTPPPLPGEKYAHQWSFMLPQKSLSLRGDYNTGTIAIVSGVVTLTSGTWPSYAADGELIVNGTSYEVDTRDGDTQLTLVDLTVDVDPGASYSLGFPYYDLPDDYGAIEGPLWFQPGSSAIYGPVEVGSEYQINVKRQASEYTSIPERAAIRPKEHDATVGTRWQIIFWPTPDQAYTIYYKYKRNPDKIDATNIYALGGMPHSETIKEAILSAAEDMLFDKRGVHFQKFMECLVASVSHDRTASTPEYLGTDRDRSDRGSEDPSLHTSNGIVTYNGVNPGP